MLFFKLPFTLIASDRIDELNGHCSAIYRCACRALLLDWTLFERSIDCVYIYSCEVRHAEEISGALKKRNPPSHWVGVAGSQRYIASQALATQNHLDADYQR